MTTIQQPAGASFSASSVTLEDLEIVPLTNLLAIYLFSEGSGVSAADMAGLAAPATITPGSGGAWIAGGGYALDGVTSYITIPIAGRANLSISVLVKPYDTAGAVQGTLVSTRGGNQKGDALLWQKSNGQLYRQKVGASGTNNSLAFTAGLAPSGVWRPLIMTSAGAAYDAQKLDTGEMVSGTVAGGTATPGTLNITLGRNTNNDTPGPGFDYCKFDLRALIVHERQLSGAVARPGVPSERQKVMNYFRAIMAASGAAI